MIIARLRKLADNGRAQADQALGLRLHASLTLRPGNVLPAADADVEVQPVLNGLDVIDLLEPDVGASALRVTEPVLAEVKVLLGEALSPVVVVPALRAAVRAALRGPLSAVSGP